MDNFNLDINKKYTYSDYLNWTFEERIELIKGEIFILASFEGLKHQRISTILIGFRFGKIVSDGEQSFSFGICYHKASCSSITPKPSKLTILSSSLKNPLIGP